MLSQSASCRFSPFRATDCLSIALCFNARFYSSFLGFIFTQKNFKKKRPNFFGRLYLVLKRFFFIENHSKIMHTICPFLRKKSGVSVADLENYMLLLSSFQYKYISFF